jgi:hypothetical protein
MYGFSLSELIHLHHPYSSDCPPLPSCLRLPPSPTHSGRRSLGHATFITLQVLFGSPTTDRASLTISLWLIGSLTPVSPETLPVLLRSRAVLPCRAVLPAITLVRWVNENAFVPEVQTRPCPTFGRPVHLGDGPHRLQPCASPHALRIPPYDGHPALRSTTSSGSRSVLAISSFRFRARLDVSINFCFLRPARLLSPLLDMAPLIKLSRTSWEIPCP